jgi:hypothetical protein
MEKSNVKTLVHLSKNLKDPVMLLSYLSDTYLSPLLAETANPHQAKGTNLPLNFPKARPSTATSPTRRLLTMIQLK